MREIKFRVWDKSLKYMHVVGTDSHDTLICYDGKVLYYNLQNGEGSAEFGDYILMQYAGLKDKNGVDIFEGDIIQYEDYINNGYRDTEVTRNTEVTFSLGMFWGGYGYNLAAIRKKAEVIGNIYEHTHLLEVKNDG